MKLEQTTYAGWNHNLKLSNGVIELIATLDVGPRIIHFGFCNGQNLFNNFEEQVGQTGGQEWKNYGGHRLWHAPEVAPRTYYPDNKPVEYDWNEKTLILTPPEEESNRLQLQMEIEMDDQAGVRIIHRITNTHVWDVELAPWSLSVMAAGGRAIFPQEPYVAHGETFSPARPLIIWPFANMADPRFTWGERFVQIRQDDRYPTKQKIGALNSLGWAAYALGPDVFITRFGYDPEAQYPDMNSNCEFYTEPGFLEVETLAPMTVLAPGESAEHMEIWSLHELTVSEDETDIAEKLLPLI